MKRHTPTHDYERIADSRFATPTWCPFESEGVLKS